MSNFVGSDRSTVRENTKKWLNWKYL